MKRTKSRRRTRRAAKYNQNGVIGTAALLSSLAGLAVVGVVGYFIYKAVRPKLEEWKKSLPAKGGVFHPTAGFGYFTNPDQWTDIPATTAPMYHPGFDSRVPRVQGDVYTALPMRNDVPPVATSIYATANQPPGHHDLRSTPVLALPQHIYHG